MKKSSVFYCIQATIYLLVHFLVHNCKRYFHYRFICVPSSTQTLMQTTWDWSAKFCIMELNFNCVMITLYNLGVLDEPTSPLKKLVCSTLNMHPECSIWFTKFLQWKRNAPSSNINRYESTIRRDPSTLYYTRIRIRSLTNRVDWILHCKQSESSVDWSSLPSLQHVYSSMFLQVRFSWLDF